MTDEIDTTVTGAHLAVQALEEELAKARDRRALAFALANEKGRSSGDVARLLGMTPMQALHIIRTGHRVLRDRRSRLARKAAA